MGPTTRPRRHARAPNGRYERARWHEAEALRLRIAGCSYRAIGEHLSVSGQSAWAAVQRALAATAALAEQDATELRALELERIEHLWQVAWPRAMAGDLAAMEKAINLMTRRSRLLGLDLTNVQLTMDEDALAMVAMVIADCVKDPAALARIRLAFAQLAQQNASVPALPPPLVEDPEEEIPQ